MPLVDAAAWVIAPGQGIGEWAARKADVVQVEPWTEAAVRRRCHVGIHSQQRAAAQARLVRRYVEEIGVFLSNPA